MKKSSVLVLVAALCGATAGSMPPAKAGEDTLAAAELKRALNLPADRANGSRLYHATCATCHGAKGQGSSNDRVPRIASQHYRVIIRQLVDYRHGRRFDERMQAATTEHVLRDAHAIVDVAHYVNLLRPGGPGNIGTGLLVQQGAQTYDALCRSCHQAGGRGSDGAGVPRLAGQNYGYLARQFSDIAAGKRPNVSVAHERLLRPLEYQELQGLADYLSQLMDP